MEDEKKEVSKKKSYSLALQPCSECQMRCEVSYLSYIFLYFYATGNFPNMSDKKKYSAGIQFTAKEFDA